MRFQHQNIDQYNKYESNLLVIRQCKHTSCLLARLDGKGTSCRSRLSAASTWFGGQTAARNFTTQPPSRCVQNPGNECTHNTYTRVNRQTDRYIHVITRSDKSCMRSLAPAGGRFSGPEPHERRHTSHAQGGLNADSALLSNCSHCACVEPRLTISRAWRRPTRR